MKKTISLTHPRHAPPQALAAVKNTLRKYLKRERGKELPEGSDYWDFDCKVGRDEASATAAHVEELIPRIDGLANEGAQAVYVEILARPATRGRRPEAGKAKRQSWPG